MINNKACVKKYIVERQGERSIMNCKGKAS